MSSDQPLPEQNRMLGIGLRASATLAFGLMAAMLKLSNDYGVEPGEMLFYRALFAFPIVLVWLAVGPGFGAVRTKRPVAHFFRSVLGIGSILLTFKALTMLSLADATTIGFSAPIFATILSALILKEKVRWHRWSAVVIGFLGILVVVQPGSNAIPFTGLLIALASALGTAGVTITLRQLSRTESAAGIVFWFFFYSLVAGSVILIFAGQVHDRFVYLLLFIAGMAGGVAQLLQTSSLRYAPVSVLSPFDYVQFLWAVLFGWLIWHRGVSVETWIGAAMIIASGLYTFYREQKLRRLTRSDTETAGAAL